MVNRKQIVIGVVAVAALAALIIWLMPDEKKAIQKRFVRMSKLTRKTGEESLFVTASQAKAFSELLSDPCELKSNIHSLGGSYSQREAAMAFGGIRTQFDTMSLDLVDLAIELPQKDKARVTLTAKFNATRSGERVSEVRELDCTLLKLDGKWLFNTCQVVEVFQK